MPTQVLVSHFGTDFDSLTLSQQAALPAAVEADPRRGRGFCDGPRINGVEAAWTVLELTRGGGGRAAFEYGEPVAEGRIHILWRQARTHAVLDRT